MLEQINKLEEELDTCSRLAAKAKRGEGTMSSIEYRGCERSMQLLIEACIGIAKQRLKSLGLMVPSNAREAFFKLQSNGVNLQQVDWVAVIGMRNVLVHDYLNFERERLMSIIIEKRYQPLIIFAREQLASGG